MGSSVGDAHHVLSRHACRTLRSWPSGLDKVEAFSPPAGPSERSLAVRLHLAKFTERRPTDLGYLSTSIQHCTFYSTTGISSCVLDVTFWLYRTTPTATAEPRRARTSRSRHRLRHPAMKIYLFRLDEDAGIEPMPLLVLMRPTQRNRGSFQGDGGGVRGRRYPTVPMVVRLHRQILHQQRVHWLRRQRRGELKRQMGQTSAGPEWRRRRSRQMSVESHWTR
ncbi:hypothetical protein BIW11_13147 [Tropilaelaps mercedesae]|uniref:Uncharacterized protein n=1 Tax=Tropilaelaps mercedesae TaxID=418985 RepID=A0A1V9X3A5_9ACAR|nr:hypothetical protein BIW11_13147 [Tropilaelaps mercedesae]